MKIRIGHISNSSTCSFVIPHKFITQEQRQQIRDWYAKKSVDTYMDDEGSCIYDEGQFLVGTIAYVKDDFLKFAEEIGIDRNDILLMEY